MSINQPPHSPQPTKRHTIVWNITVDQPQGKQLHIRVMQAIFMQFNLGWKRFCYIEIGHPGSVGVEGEIPVLGHFSLNQYTSTPHLLGQAP